MILRSTLLRVRARSSSLDNKTILKPGSDGPWVAASTPSVLAAWIKLREVNPSLKVKAELYEPPIVADVANGLQTSYCDLVNLTMIPLAEIPLAVHAALKEKSQMIVALFDGDIRKNVPSVLDAIKYKVTRTDRQIYEEVGGAPELGVARAVFLLNLPRERVPDRLVLGARRNWWVLVPMDHSDGFRPPNDRIALINEQLGR